MVSAKASVASGALLALLGAHLAAATSMNLNPVTPDSRVLDRHSPAYGGRPAADMVKPIVFEDPTLSREEISKEIAANGTEDAGNSTVSTKRPVTGITSADPDQRRAQSTTPKPSTKPPTTRTPSPTYPRPTSRAPPAPGVQCGNDAVGPQPCPSGEYCQPWNPGYYQCRKVPGYCGVQEVGVDYYGDDLAKFQLLLPEECCAKCFNTAECNAYTFVNYNADGKAYCYLKKGVGQKTKKVGVVSASMKPSCPTPSLGGCGNAAAGYSCCPGGQYCQPWDVNYYQCLPTPTKCSVQLPGIDFYGDDLATVFGVGPAECCARCASTAGCKAYTYVNDNFSNGVATPACYLKTGSGSIQTNAHAVSGLLN